MTVVDDFQKLEHIIKIVEHKVDVGDMQRDDITKYQKMLDALAERYQNDEPVGSQRFMLYELQAMLWQSRGNNEQAVSFLKEAQRIKDPGIPFVSRAAQNWENEQLEAQPSVQTSRFSGKLEGWLTLYAVGLFATLLFLLYDLSSIPKVKNEFSSLPSDFQTYLYAAFTFDIAAIICIGVVAYFFFTKQRVTRPLAIAFGFGVLIFEFILFSLLTSLENKHGFKSTDSSGSFVTIGGLLWPFYWIFSKRVKATFVN